MRIFSLLLVVLVLGLSMAPCCTPVIGNSPAMAKQVSTEADCCKSDCEKENQNADDPLPSENSCGTCSPFYTCGSCSGYTLQDVYQFNFIVNVYSKEHRLLDCSFDSEYFHVKWQPPKISSFFY